MTVSDVCDVISIKDVLDEWLLCQRAWLYLEPIFSAEDIIRQLPVESKRYQTMERIWRKVMKQAKDNPEVSFYALKRSLNFVHGDFIKFCGKNNKKWSK